MPEELSAAVAEQIRRLLDAHKISGNALATAIGMPQSSISRKLNDKAPFDLDDVQKICAFLGIEEADLIAWAKRGVQRPSDG